VYEVKARLRPCLSASPLGMIMTPAFYGEQ
jgi:hypothetical protein